MPGSERRGCPVWLLIPLGAAALVFAAVGAYAWIASGLPPVTDLQGRVSQYRSTRLYDRDGGLIHETLTPDAGLRTPVTLDSVSPWLVRATLATEDANFYRHGGVDPVAIVRAVWYALSEREVVSGGSTITQQLARRAFLNAERTISRKVREAVLAIEMSRRYDKDTILEIYLNEIYYGNHAYGIEAAAKTYFGVPASDLDAVQSALLAGLPQAPAYHDPYANPERAAARRGVVLGLMAEVGYLSHEESRTAAATPLDLMPPPRFELTAPHFTLTVLEQLEALFGPEARTHMGLNVTTTLDPRLQDLAERSVAESVAELEDRDVSNGALVALEPSTGAVRALVGSADFHDEDIGGQVNMVLAPRQPGSTMKPIAVLAAFEGIGQGLDAPLTPGSLLPDIAVEYPMGAGGVYRPRNYDGREHGMVTLKAALANSYNIPMIRLLDRLGVPALLETSKRLGITTLTGDQYGLSLVLGGGEVSALEMAAAYGVFANSGALHPATLIERVVDGSGATLCASDSDVRCQGAALAGAEGAVPAPIARSRVADPDAAFLVADILSDVAARAPAFSGSPFLDIGRPAAVKTGTTDDYRDSWTIGFTPGLLAAAWMGNSDYSPMRQVPGSMGGARIWHRFMTAAHEGDPVQSFAPTSGVERFTVCRDTGARPSVACPDWSEWWFDADNPPAPPEDDLWQRVALDPATGLLAGDVLPGCLAEERDFKVYPAEFREWAIANGIPQPPEETAPSIEPRVEIAAPREGAPVTGTVVIAGSAAVPGFAEYSIWRGEGSSPRVFDGPEAGPFREPVVDGVLAELRVGDWTPGQYVLRLRVMDACGGESDARVRVRVAAPVITQTATLTVTLTPATTPSPTRTSSPPLPKASATGPAPTLAIRPTSPPTAAPRPTDPATAEPRPSDPPTAEPPTPTPEPLATELPSPATTPEPPAAPATEPVP